MEPPKKIESAGGQSARPKPPVAPAPGHLEGNRVAQAIEELKQPQSLQEHIDSLRAEPIPAEQLPQTQEELLDALISGAITRPDATPAGEPPSGTSQPRTTSQALPQQTPKAPVARSGASLGLAVFVLVAAAVAWVAIAYVTRSRKAKEEQQRAVESEERQTAAAVMALASKYDAVTNWDESLPERLFSIDVSRALVRSDHRPVLAEISLRDLTEQDGKIIASFSLPSWSSRLGSARFDLQCGLEQLSTLSNAVPLCRFAVIARVMEVQRLRGEDEGFVLRGECVDLLRLP